jgi:hypothetical protein
MSLLLDLQQCGGNSWMSEGKWQTCTRLPSMMPKGGSNLYYLISTFITLLPTSHHSSNKIWCAPAWNVPEWVRSSHTSAWNFGRECKPGCRAGVPAHPQRANSSVACLHDGPPVCMRQKQNAKNYQYSARKCAERQLRENNNIYLIT